MHKIHNPFEGSSFPHITMLSNVHKDSLVPLAGNEAQRPHSCRHLSVCLTLQLLVGQLAVLELHTYIFVGVCPSLTQ